jgi:hypothetical protein
LHTESEEVDDKEAPFIFAPGEEEAGLAAAATVVATPKLEQQLLPLPLGWQHRNLDNHPKFAPTQVPLPNLGWMESLAM